MAENVIFDTKDYGAMTTHFYDVLGVFVYVVSPPQFELVLGQTYKVVWDGVAYEATALDTGAIIPGSISIGNGAAWGYPGNNEPFSVVYTPGSDVTFVSMTDTASTTHTVAVYHITEDAADDPTIYTIKATTLKAIADSIRTKTGSTDKMTAEHFPGAISSITGGGGGSAEGCVTVTFMNGDTELFSRPVYIGDDCPNPVDQNRIDTPTKESTAQYNYVFYGWGASDGGAADGDILKNITEDKTVYAVFSAVVRTYTITWLDEDGVTVLKQEQLAYGTVPSYAPTKEGVTFDSWTPTPVEVTGNASYTAVWLAKLTFATSLWSDIARVAEAGEAQKHFALGDTRVINVGGTDVTFFIAGFNHDDLANGTGKAGITLVAKTAVGSVKMSVNAEYQGYTLDNQAVAYKSKLEADLQPFIKQVKKQVDKGTKCLVSDATTTTISRYMWVPSVQELGITNISSNAKGKLQELGSRYDGYNFFPSFWGSPIWLRNLVYDSTSYTRQAKMSSYEVGSNGYQDSAGVILAFCI